MCRRSKDMSSFSLGMIFLSPRLFRLLYRPDARKDSAYLLSWKTFVRTLPSSDSREERAADNDDLSLTEMFSDISVFPPHSLPPASVLHSGTSSRAGATLPPSFLAEVEAKQRFEIDAQELLQENTLPSDLTDEDDGDEDAEISLMTQLLPQPVHESPDGPRELKFQSFLAAVKLSCRNFSLPEDHQPP